MTTIIVETPRLILRHFTPEDAEAYHREIYSDAEVMRTLLGAPKQSVDETARVIEKLQEHQREHGFGLWAVIEKTAGDLIGHAGLYTMRGTADIEVAYALGQRFWGKGYATEAARACLVYAFNTLEIDTIYGVALPDNTASRHVLAKIGMRYEGIVDRYFGMSLPCYYARREDYGESDVEVGE